MNDMPKDQALWNAIFSAFFLLVLVVVFWGLTDGLDQFGWLYLMSPIDIIIISLATFRITRLVTSDKIFAFVRSWFMDTDESGLESKPKGGPRRTVAEIIECLWCTGLWAALLVTALYFAADVGRFFVVILAIAAVGSFLQNFSHMIGRIGK